MGRVESKPLTLRKRLLLNKFQMKFAYNPNLRILQPEFQVVKDLFIDHNWEIDSSSNLCNYCSKSQII